ncbi:hypothetical protein T484DRAFT_1824210, partial [Baffinella frigidus]
MAQHLVVELGRSVWLKKELHRLRKEEPKLAVREAEFAALVQERDRLITEAHVTRDEVDANELFTKEKIEEVEFEFASSSQELDERK